MPVQPEGGELDLVRAWELHQAGRVDEAEAAYRRCIARDPGASAAWNNLASLLVDRGRYADAEGALRELLRLDPRHPQGMVNLGCELVRSKRLDEALVHLRHAVECHPLNPDAWNTLGVCYAALARADEAQAAYEHVLQLAPGHPGALGNLGTLLFRRGHLEQAEASLRKAIEARPAANEPRLNLYLVLLAQGRYRDAWPLQEQAFAFSQLPQPAPPLWRGEPLAGRSLLVWHEQGFGDTIQFIRYAPMLKARGASHVTLACPPALAPLLVTMRGIDRVVADTNPPPPADLWVPTIGLPAAFESNPLTLPADLPYVSVSPTLAQTWRARLPAGRKVGLAWRGTPNHSNDAHRSIAELETLAPLWRVPGVSFVSLQKGAGTEADAARPRAGQPLLALGQDIDNFADLAAVIAELDLVISVDTAAAHLAGALGKAVWVLLPAWRTDWRWMRGRDDTPWYPGVMRLYRQSGVGDWPGVIERVAVDLAAWAAKPEKGQGRKRAIKPARKAGPTRGGRAAP